MIAAIEGPAVAGGMELALWADCRVMAEGAYMGVYNRRWGVPLSDGGTVRLPRLVGQGRALEIIMTGRKVERRRVPAHRPLRKARAQGEARRAAEDMAHEIARFPQACLRADRRSVYFAARPIRARRAGARMVQLHAASSRRRVPPAPHDSPRAPDGTAIFATADRPARGRPFIAAVRIAPGETPGGAHQLYSHSRDACEWRSLLVCTMLCESV